MRLLNRLSGGYRRVMDRLLDLQTEMITMGNATFAAIKFDLVLQGCDVHDNGNGTVNIAPGIMYVSGQVLRFDGADNIADNASMAIIVGAPVASVLRPFADGSNKMLYSESKAVVGLQSNDNPFQMKITTSLYSLQQYIKDQINANEPKGTIKEIYDLDGTFAANFDFSGLGITPAWLGWALDNGDNDTPGSVGRVTINQGKFTDPLDGSITEYDANQQYGALSQKLQPGQAPTPAGLVTQLDGPHNKPGDGGGAPEFYVRQISAAAPASEKIVQLPAATAVYRVVKVVAP